MKGITETIKVVDPDIISQLEGESNASQYSKQYDKLDVLDLEAVRSLKKTIKNPENKYYQSLELLESNNKLIRNMSNEYEAGMSVFSSISDIVLLIGIISILADWGNSTGWAILGSGIVLVVFSNFFGRMKRENNVKNLILLSERIVEHKSIEDIIESINPQKYFHILSELNKEQLPPISSLQRRLGDCYNFGYGVDEDFEVALEWYSKAANNRKPDMKACKCMKNIAEGIATSYQNERDSQDFIERGIGKAWRWISGESEISDEEQDVINSVKYYTEKYEELKSEYDRLCGV